MAKKIIFTDFRNIEYKKNNFLGNLQEKFIT